MADTSATALRCEDGALQRKVRRAYRLFNHSRTLRFFRGKSLGRRAKSACDMSSVLYYNEPFKKASVANVSSGYDGKRSCTRLSKSEVFGGVNLHSFFLPVEGVGGGLPIPRRSLGGGRLHPRWGFHACFQKLLL
jgi:hypothetical protein